MVEETGESHDCKKDPGQQRNEKRPLHPIEMFAETLQISPDEGAEGRAAFSDRIDETFVDAEDEGDGPPRYARDQIGGTHEETADDDTKKMNHEGSSMAM
jgi:hypothetical protein